MVGTPVSGPLLMAKAQQLFPLLYPDIDSSSFKGGTGWLKRFRERHGVRGVSIQGESLSASADTVEPFKIKLSKIMEEKGISLTQLFNCDETGLYWRLMPRKTLITAREKDAKGFKKPKDRVTLMACANVTGSIKLPLVFIHKSASPRCFKNFNKSSLPVDYYAQKNSWMNSEIFTKWFHEKFVPNCKKSLTERNLPPKALLVLDNAPCHPDVDYLESNDGQITCLYLPPNTTSIIQPMDQGVLETIKRQYKRDLLLRMLHDESTIDVFCKKINILDAILMAAKSWDEVCHSTICKSWKKLLPMETIAEEEPSSSEVEQSEIATADIQELCNDGEFSDCQTEWLTADSQDCGYHDYTEEEIIALATEQNEGNDNESEDEDDGVSHVVSHSQACDALETVLTYLQQQAHVPESTTVTINSLLIETNKKRYNNLKQTKLSKYFNKQ